MEALSQTIGAETEVLASSLRKMGQPEPTFAPDGPVQVLPPGAPEAALKARASIIEACFKLFQLVTGPSELLPTFMANYQTLFSFHWLVHFDILLHIPLEGSINYDALAAAANVPESQLRSISRMAMTSNVLCETADKRLAHTAASAMFVNDPNMLHWARFMCGTSVPTASSMVEATERWPGSQQKTETAYNVAFNHKLPFFDHLAQDSELHEQFSGYMKSVTGGEGTNLTHLIQGFPWETLPNDSLVIDVSREPLTLKRQALAELTSAFLKIGGSTGHGTFALAKAYPSLRFEVQDLDHVVKNGVELLEKQPPSVAERVSFRSHDFFHAQQVHGARVYLLRMILHDWAGPDAVKILANIAAAMSADSTLLIMDTVLPDPGDVPVTVERVLRVRDLTMMQGFNSKERTLDDWTELLAAADQRLSLVDVKQPAKSHMSLLSLSLKREAGEFSI